MKNVPATFSNAFSKLLWSAEIVKASVNSATYKTLLKTRSQCELTMSRVNVTEM